MHSSVKKMWNKYLESIDSQSPSNLTYDSWHFGDNEKDANELAELVLRGNKTATAPSVWELELQGEPIPEPGDLHVVTNWEGIAQCVIQTTNVVIVPFSEVTAEHARLEGEGDQSLEFWLQVHWGYYQRVLEKSDMEPTTDMPIVCEQFKVVYT